MDKLKLLKKYWGYSSFRSNQEQIIDNLLKGKDTIGILPTSGGKSICYQLPAMIMEGPVLVISPLIALMIDQVRELERLGIKAMYFESHCKSPPIQQQIDNCIHGNYNLVYSSPERFLNSFFINHLKQVNFSLITIDEAHCISEWGQDFRPSYRELGLLQTFFPKTPTLALTGSATIEVEKDIRDILKLKDAKLFKSSFERTNISYNVLKTFDKYSTLLKLLAEKRGSGIIYCNSRKLTENLSQFINLNGHGATFFHGGLNMEQKKKNLKLWKSGDLEHIVTTSALSMGINKSDVRMIIHFQFPESIENFYQETGRAGRDKKDAFCYLLYQNNDSKEIKNQFLKKIPTKNEIENTYKSLCNFFQIAFGEGKGNSFSLDLKSFCKRYNQSINKTQQVIKFFQIAGVYDLVISNEKKIYLNVITSIDHIISYIENRNLAAQILEFIMRKNPYFIDKTTILSPNKLCKVFKISFDHLLDEFEILNKRRILDFKIHETDIEIIPLTPRQDKYTIKPVIDLAKKIMLIKKKKIRLMVQFLENDFLCKRNYVLSYFGEIKNENCKKCSSYCCNINTVKTK